MQGSRRGAATISHRAGGLGAGRAGINQTRRLAVSGDGRSVMDDRVITVADPVAMVAAGLRLVDCYGAPWVALELPERGAAR